MSDWAIVVAGLGGAAVGALGSGGVSLWLEKQRWHRSERTRWLDERRRLYARFLEAVGEVLAASSQQTLQMSVGSMPPLESMQRVAEADRSMRLALSDIELIGGDAEVDAANRLRDAVSALIVENASGRAGERLQSASDEWNRAHQAFKDVARRSVQPVEAARR